MATIKQVIAAIGHDGTMGPNQKRFVIDAISRAETWISLSSPAKPRKITNSKNLMPLEDWEVANGQLRTSMLSEWVKARGLCPVMVAQMVAEFRTEMMAKGKQYNNFKAAFQTYLTKGYLSKPLTACTLERSTYKSQTVIETKGGVL